MKNILFSEYVNQKMIVTNPAIISKDTDHRYSIKIPFKNRENGITTIVIMKNPSAAGKTIKSNGQNKILSDDTIYTVLDYLYKLKIPIIKEVIIVNLMSIYSGTLSNIIKKAKTASELSSANNLTEIKLILKKKNEKDTIIVAWGGYPKYPKTERSEDNQVGESKKIEPAPYNISIKELNKYYDTIIDKVHKILKNETVYIVGSLNENGFPPHGKNWYDYEELNEYIIPQ